MTTPVTLDTEAAAAILGKSTSWLKKGRCSGSPTAPPFLKIGRSVRYLRSDLEAFLARRRFTSTIAARAAADALSDTPLSDS